MKHKLKRDMLRLGAVMGTSVSIAAIVFTTGAMANGHLHPREFITYIVIAVVVALISINYINHNTEGGEWI